MTTDLTPPHGLERPDLTDVLRKSLDALHAVNTGRPLRCLDCDVVFMDPLVGFDHLKWHESRKVHPSGRGPGQ